MKLLPLAALLILLMTTACDPKNTPPEEMTDSGGQDVEFEYEFDFTTEDEQAGDDDTPEEAPADKTVKNNEGTFAGRAIDYPAGQAGGIKRSQFSALRWKGVRSCNRKSRAQSALDKALDQWIKSELSAHPEWVLRASGWDDFKFYSYNYNGRIWDRKRSCKGSAYVTLMAIFYAPDQASATQ